ncbi:MAG TPA: hypothetical protein VM841_02720, partial [Actinomycetota bacterium]|nr:hypothetical protein [Actinomycetota bacterium]
LAPLPAGSATGTVNSVPVLRPSGAPFGGGTVEALRFGEAALNLGAIFGPTFPGCPGFAQFWVKTRASGESFNSQLKDRGKPVPLTLARCPDVHVTKSPQNQTLDVGETVSFTLVATNDGIAPATGVVVTDNLLNVLTDVSAIYDVDPGSPGGTGTCSIRSPILVRCEIGTLAASDGNTTGAEPDTVVVTITATTTPASCGERGNKAHVEADAEAEADTGDNDSNRVSFTVRCADVAIIKTPDALEVNAGSPAGFTIEATNQGGGTATGVTITDVLPAGPGLDWSVDAVSSGMTCGIAAGTLTCTQPALAPGASIRVHMTTPTAVGSCGTIDNTASVTTTNDGGDEAHASIRVLCPSLGIEKTADDEVVTAGESIGFTISVSNDGAGTATSVTLSDTLPAGPGLGWAVDGGSAAGRCAIEDGVLSCDLGDLAAGAGAEVHISSRTSGDSCGSYENLARASAANHGEVAARATTRVDCAAIEILKTADEISVEAGGPAGFTIEVRNGGDGIARGVVVRDPLPANPGLSWTIDGGSAAGACTIAEGVLGCDLGTLAPGEAATVHIASPTDGRSCGPIVNVAAVNTSNDGSALSSATIVVDCRIGIGIVKEGPDLAHRGDVIEYTMAVTTSTLTPLAEVTVTDPLCDAAPLLRFGDDGDGLLEVGETWMFTCTHVVASGSPDPLPNTAVASGVGNRSPVTASDDHVVDLIAPAIAIDKTVTPVSGTTGTPVTYTYVVTNTGDTTLFDVEVNDDVLGPIGTVAVLAPGSSETFTRASVLGAAAITNIGIASGEDVLGLRVTAIDPATTTVVAGIRLVRTGSGTAGWLAGALLVAAGSVMIGAGRRRGKRAEA